MSEQIFSQFHPLIQQWFKEKIGRPTEIQINTWREIMAENHILMTAPTGSGKTLAAFLWAVNQLITGQWHNNQTRVLYISPLKALNNDIQKNLIRPVTEIKHYFRQNQLPFPELNILTRSGDSQQKERQRIFRTPPEILITTPESLNILLSSKSGRQVLCSIATVILDEIHAVVNSKRGTHLITAVDRLIPLCGEFQRIAISATVKPLAVIAEFIGGRQMIESGQTVTYRKRKVKIIQSKAEKKYQVKICFPANARLNQEEDSWWPVLIEDFKKIILKNDSTLFFTNSRRITEKITRFINENMEEELAYSHHGSLSREIRYAVEQKLKNKELKAIVATNSLELGIDIGQLDQVVLVQTPFSISSTIQRIGRSGHEVGGMSKGMLYPNHGRDFLEAAVMSRLVMNKEIEETHPIQGALDILAQIIISMTALETWSIDQLYDFLKTSYPYYNLSRKHYDLVLEMLAGKYADLKIRELRPRVHLDQIDQTIKAKDGMRYLLYTSGGTIPDLGYYTIRLESTKAKIGELDEEFVWERKIGDRFALSNQVWRVLRITHNDVEVVPTEHNHQIIPFWRGDEQNRDFYLAEKISLFLEKYNASIEKESFKKDLAAIYGMNEPAIAELVLFLKRQKNATQTDLPHRHHLLIEHFDDPLNTSGNKQVILHTLWGGRLNHPFTLAFSAAWKQKYRYPLQTFVNNDCIVLIFPHELKTSQLLELVNSENLEKLISLELEKTGYFGAKFRENAGRAMLLIKKGLNQRMPLWLNRLRSKKLLQAISHYEQFPIVLETWRECLQDDFDLFNLKKILDEIRAGEIKISETITHKASPFSDSIIWKQTNELMYDTDNPLTDSQVDRRSLMEEIVHASHLRPHIPEKIILIFQQKVQRLSPGYCPSDPDDLIDWIKERLLLPEAEWQLLLEQMLLDRQLSESDLLEEINEKVLWLRADNSPKKWLMAIESMPFLLKCLDQTLENLTIMPIQDRSYLAEKIRANCQKMIALSSRKKNSQLEEEEKPLLRFIRQWLSYYGPISRNQLQERLFIPIELLDQALSELESLNQIIIDQISSRRELEICDSENLEILLRMTRNAQKPAFKPLPISKLALFLSHYQSVAHKGQSIENLQSALEQLIGCPAPVTAWEEYILPARLEPYFSNWLDQLFYSSDLLWFGCGLKKIAFAFPEDLSLLTRGKKAAKNELLSLLPDDKGRYPFFELSSHSGLGAKELTLKLWQNAWKGWLSNDSFITIRKGILNHFKPETAREKRNPSRRIQYNRWQSSRPLTGNWYCLPLPGEKNGLDILEQEEKIKDRVRLLLDRYGILFREILKNELPDFQWSRLFRSLRIMELSGEILSGCFFYGLAGPQFISHSAYRLLQKGLDEEVIYWLNAADPASLCGLQIENLKGILPSRLPTSYLVYHGSRLVMVIRKNSKIVEIKTPPDDPCLPRYFSIFKFLLSRDFNALTKIVIEKINETVSNKSVYLDCFMQFGFKKSYKGLELWKNYPSV